MNEPGSRYFRYPATGSRQLAPYNARSISHVEDIAERHSQTELILMLMKSRQTAADTQTIYKTDGVSVFGTRTIETDEDALPVVGVA